ncbi:transcriptional regulator [Sporomusaceae bacterium FL31]|nr:transcriptional regulator [Sporomusaceae bacterium FL31]GCE32806.1 transcriptional regulator [Sporomusaceae bacterium]
MFAQKYKVIGLKIAYFRKMKGYTQEELARRAQISTSYLSRIERGNYTKSVSLSVLLIIAQALEIDIDALVCDKGPN